MALSSSVFCRPVATMSRVAYLTLADVGTLGMYMFFTHIKKQMLSSRPIDAVSIAVLAVGVMCCYISGEVRVRSRHRVRGRAVLTASMSC